MPEKEFNKRAGVSQHNRVHRFTPRRCTYDRLSDDSSLSLIFLFFSLSLSPQVDATLFKSKGKGNTKLKTDLGEAAQGTTDTGATGSYVLSFWKAQSSRSPNPNPNPNPNSYSYPNPYPKPNPYPNPNPNPNPNSIVYCTALCKTRSRVRLRSTPYTCIKVQEQSQQSAKVRPCLTSTTTSSAKTTVLDLRTTPFQRVKTS
jgi:hypothetical protein